MKKGWTADKPGSVYFEPEDLPQSEADGHLSRTTIARGLQRSTREYGDSSKIAYLLRRIGISLCLILLQAGFAKPLKSP